MDCDEQRVYLALLIDYYWCWSENNHGIMRGWVIEWKFSLTPVPRETNDTSHAIVRPVAKKINENYKEIWFKISNWIISCKCLWRALWSIFCHHSFSSRLDSSSKHKHCWPKFTGLFAENLQSFLWKKNCVLLLVARLTNHHIVVAASKLIIPSPERV